MTPQEALEQLPDDRLNEAIDQLFDLGDQEFEEWVEQQEDGELISLALPLMFLTEPSEAS